MCSPLAIVGAPGPSHCGVVRSGSMASKGVFDVVDANRDVLVDFATVKSAFHDSSRSPDRKFLIGISSHFSGLRSPGIELS